MLWIVPPSAIARAMWRNMLAIFHHRSFISFFYSNEGTPREPFHVHIEKDELEAKSWLYPEVRVAYI